MVTGFVPSYEFDSGIGKEIARLKGLEEGWHYPTFLLQYIRNPGPLLLFDEILVDAGAAEKAVEYVAERAMRPRGYERKVVQRMKPTESEAEMLQQLIHSSLFKKENIAKMITTDDFERIRRGYFRDLGIGASPGRMPDEFERGVAILKSRYGVSYASPDPARFEAMNLNVTWVLLRKLSAIPLDDILRSPLYEHKAIQSASLAMDEVKTAHALIDQARQVLHLPSRPLLNIDDFLALYKDPRVVSFRREVAALSQARASPRQIARKIDEANLEMHKLEVNSYGLVIGLFGMVGGLIAMLGGLRSPFIFATGSVATAGALVRLSQELRKPSMMERHEWLEMIRGLCEI